MNTAEFNAECRKRNKVYREIFGCIPRVTDYVCTREEYIASMDKSIKTGEPLEHFMQKKGAPLSPDALL